MKKTLLLPITGLHYTLFRVILIAFLLPAFTRVYTQQVAFPGAEGYGKYSTGGRGGQVVKVTNLQDDGAGSFRQALAAFPGQPLTVVFDVSGIIELRTPIVIKRSYITIAGQTAPGDGICLKGNSFMLNGAGQGGNKQHIIIRFIRSRPGSTLKNGVYGFDMENCSNVIIDHCSFSWANEECAAMYDTKNTTVQWCIVSEGLYNAGHMKGHRSYAGVWGGQFASYHHNLIAHQNSRTVRFNGGRAHDTVALVDYRNNVIYNWGNPAACYGGDINIAGAVSQVNLVNNYYKPGPATPGELNFLQPWHAGTLSKGVGQWFLSGNIMAGNKRLTRNNWLAVDLTKIPPDSRHLAKATKAFPVAIALPGQNTAEAYEAVLEKAGAIRPSRDAVDARVVTETRTGTASGMGSFGKPGIIDLPAAVGGWPVYKNAVAPADKDADGMPDEWEKRNSLNPADPADRNHTGGGGYTMLEIYLNELAGVN